MRKLERGNWAEMRTTNDDFEVGTILSVIRHNDDNTYKCFRPTNYDEDNDYIISGKFGTVHEDDLKPWIG